MLLALISVPAEDLEKALNSTVWPLQDFVHEFIHYILIEMELQVERKIVLLVVQQQYND